MDWIIFALIAPLCWAIGSILIKFLRVNYMDSPLGYLVFIAPTAVLSLLLLLIKPFKYPGITNLIICFTAGIIALIGYYIWIYAIHKIDVSNAVIIGGVMPLFVLILEYIFLKETLSINDYIAFISILTGSLLISVENVNNKIAIKKETWLIMLSSLMFATHTILLKLASETNFTTAMITRETGMLMALSLVFVFSDKVREKTLNIINKLNLRNKIISYSAEILGMTGLVISYIAIQNGPASLVSLLTGFEPLYILIITAILTKFFPRIIKESINKKTIIIKIISIILMFTGLYFIII